MESQQIFNFCQKLSDQEREILKENLNKMDTNYEINPNTLEEIRVADEAIYQIKKIFDNKFTKEELDALLKLLFGKKNYYFNFWLDITDKELVNLQQFLFCYQNEIKTLFDGKLKKEELELLKANLYKEKEIKKIEGYLEKYRLSLSGYKDLVGDTLLPDKKFFFFMMKHFGYLLENDPDLVISKKGVERRRAFNPTLKKIGKNFLANPQVIENREFLEDPIKNKHLQYVPDKGIYLPNEPVVWAVNHGFKDDILTSILACPRHSYIVFGNIPQFYNTIDGITSNLNGIVPANRLVSASKKTTIPKCGKVFEYGSDVTIMAEGIWCKSINKPTLEPHAGFWHMAKEYGRLVVPMIHWVEDASNPLSVVHTVIDEPLKIDDLSLTAASELLKEVWTTWIMRIIKVYGVSTRALELDDKGYYSTYQKWEDHLKNITSQVSRYDSEAEHFADLRLGTQIEDVFLPIANMNATNEFTRELRKDAYNQVRRRERIDFQRKI